MPLPFPVSLQPAVCRGLVSGLALLSQQSGRWVSRGRGEEDKLVQTENCLGLPEPYPWIGRDYLVPLGLRG